jgi:recombinational DNA repair protein RecR
MSVLDRTGCVSCLYSIELAVCHVCMTIERQNSSTITIINQQLIKPVCCSASHI